MFPPPVGLLENKTSAELLQYFPLSLSLIVPKLISSIPATASGIFSDQLISVLKIRQYTT